MVWRKKSRKQSTYRNKVWKYRSRIIRQNTFTPSQFYLFGQKNYFNTTYFHRVVKNFIIQGGNSDESITKKIEKTLANTSFRPNSTTTLNTITEL
ncbi:peptidylprolyl isomerase [Flavobacterium piscinae]|nr:peptidylprolyl isomerase [Flavobacterium piscinae]